ncbi:hypothetical protein SAMD00019534_028110 [Acytostelium subglobosum LB1]|uniref:hypothetical protein n=1 Tax=Acytostelium subglobosum LB1 TaxID=1410327 RepID=UPI000644A5A0|nr:hypothetical protein SAMD00019534_028110 [Acytostelium subglobosum LB1]GAM19636.1 hypothetical protein SAMD00019534_028110 [Acytostelium subglobosum LB1]|eukprot:XP_012756398.1 hypothetical protein SAMD00019534_028110 [Acytostelium subglobosum LB1]
MSDDEDEAYEDEQLSDDQLIKRSSLPTTSTTTTTNTSSPSSGTNKRKTTGFVETSPSKLLRTTKPSKSTKEDIITKPSVITRSSSNNNNNNNNNSSNKKVQKKVTIVISGNNKNNNNYKSAKPNDTGGPTVISKSKALPINYDEPLSPDFPVFSPDSPVPTQDSLSVGSPVDQDLHPSSGTPSTSSKASKNDKHEKDDIDDIGKDDIGNKENVNDKDKQVGKDKEEELSTASQSIIGSGCEISPETTTTPPQPVILNNVDRIQSDGMTSLRFFKRYAVGSLPVIVNGMPRSWSMPQKKEFIAQCPKNKVTWYTYFGNGKSQSGPLSSFIKAASPELCCHKIRYQRPTNWQVPVWQMEGPNTGQLNYFETTGCSNKTKSMLVVWKPGLAISLRCRLYDTTITLLHGSYRVLLLPPSAGISNKSLSNQHVHRQLDELAPINYEFVEQNQGMVTTIDKQGQTLFIPSGWYFQIEALELGATTFIGKSIYHHNLIAYVFETKTLNRLSFLTAIVEDYKLRVQFMKEQKDQLRSPYLPIGVSKETEYSVRLNNDPISSVSLLQAEGVDLMRTLKRCSTTKVVEDKAGFDELMAKMPPLFDKLVKIMFIISNVNTP